MTIREPSGLNAAEMTPTGVPLEGEELGPVLASHTFAVPSSLAVTIRDPSGLNAAEVTPAGVPLEGEELGARSSRPTPSPSCPRSR